MISPLQRYKVSFFGELHTLVSDDAEHTVKSSVQLVDSLMKDFAQQTGCSDVKQLALLVALNLAQQRLQDQAKLMNFIDDELNSVV